MLAGKISGTQSCSGEMPLRRPRCVSGGRRAHQTTGGAVEEYWGSISRMHGDALAVNCSLSSANQGGERSPSPTIPCTDSSTFGTSSSSMSTPRVQSGVLENLPIPARIVRSLGHGNNGQVFLAHMMPNNGHEHDGEEGGTASHAAEQLQDSSNDCCVPQGHLGGARETVAPIPIAVKLMNSLSKHVQREVSCLEYLHSCRECWKGDLVAADVEGDISDPKCESSTCRESPLLSNTCLSPPPCPKLFFVKQVEGHVAIGLELLGLDLFDFTGDFILYEGELCLVGIEMLRTLSALHKRGLVHRSVKPENFCWNETELQVANDCSGLVNANDHKDKAPSHCCPPVFMFKMVDFGRGTIDASDSTEATLYERPYGGWWHSLNGFLGKPMGQKDDLMGIAHTVGYLLDDYRNYHKEASRSSSSQQEDSSDPSSTESTQSCGTVSPNRTLSRSRETPIGSQVVVHSFQRGIAVKRGREDGASPGFEANDLCNDAERSGSTSRSSSGGRTGSPPHSYSSWRHFLGDRIARAYDEVKERYKQRVAPRGAEPSYCSIKEPGAESQRELLMEEERNRRRAWIVRGVEEDFMPSLLPDNYYPPNMPQWWVDWYGQCNRCCSDASVTAEVMAEVMMDGLRQRIEAHGATVESVRHNVVNAYFSTKKRSDRVK
ncbi:Protein kinase domain containing protein, putative [Trypanosoma equiperdum]|uniref:Protein kinase domain-containing protein n=2 Tax=Trypanozoon TaxID=39700 RepID=Q386N2_TRYB2|nr:hypothetical protein, conserved [Trypanosoma brucei brucei TREU927]EAN79249.1 hypothetical protein, conserved [Trypanosoma brucei brucei TREU927]SCU72291.1 Protein kinase domain containing protein, putative [Trypanosoma equiperdum]